eukprot:IDg21788t1
MLAKSAAPSLWHSLALCPSPGPNLHSNLPSGHHWRSAHPSGRRFHSDLPFARRSYSAFPHSRRLHSTLPQRCNFVLLINHSHAQHRFRALCRLGAFNDLSAPRSTLWGGSAFLYTTTTPRSIVSPAGEHERRMQEREEDRARMEYERKLREEEQADDRARREQETKRQEKARMPTKPGTKVACRICAYAATSPLLDLRESLKDLMAFGKCRVHKATSITAAMNLF